MLRHLYIKNFALIDVLDMDFHSGFSVITGETGAGKSIILGAIGLMLGQRADSKAIKQGAEKCVIEAHFDLSRYQMEDFFRQNDIEYDAADTIIRRELMASGKSRAFINDTPVSLAMLKELGERLVDVHSQHQNLLLNKQDFQLSVVDVIAQDAALQQTYRQAFDAYQKAEHALAALKEEIAQGREKQDFLQFQYDELSGARLVEGEQEELEQRSDMMTHAEDIKTGLYEATSLLSGEEGGVVSSLRRAHSALQNVARVYPEVGELAERLSSSYIELKDVDDELSRRLDDVDFDPSELESVNARLDLIYGLQKKYRQDSVADLLKMQNSLHDELMKFENSDEAIAELERQASACLQEARTHAEALSKKRAKAAKAIERQMQERLVPLGMPHVRFEVSVTPTELNRNGQDKIAFFFSANTSTPLQPVAQVASGGEIARVMLALKAMISGAVKLPTIIFDEIDTGVSGKIAEQMAHIMAEMGAADRQVISITHLPQIAALGTTHYKVYKDESAKGTASHMQMLSTDERVTEIAQMLSGSAVSEAAIQNAKDLLKI